MNLETSSLQLRANRYKTVLQNTQNYREAWHAEIKPMIISSLTELIQTIDIKAEVKVQDKITNLEAIILDLGKSSSGISEFLEDTDIKRTMIKTNGSLIYQQLFNGKIMVMFMSPHIEGYGEPKPPKALEILRPDELKKPFFIRHIETFLKDITDWEDYDDDEPKKTGAAFNPIGFNRASEVGEDY